MQGITTGGSSLFQFLQPSGIDLTEQLIQVLGQFLHLVISRNQIPVFVVSISDFQKQATFRIPNYFQKNAGGFKGGGPAPLGGENQWYIPLI